MELKEIEGILKKKAYLKDIKVFVEMIKSVPIAYTGLDPSELLAVVDGNINYYTAGKILAVVGTINPKDISTSFNMYIGLMQKAKDMRAEWNEQSINIIEKSQLTNERTN